MPAEPSPRSDRPLYIFAAIVAVVSLLSAIAALVPLLTRVSTLEHEVKELRYEIDCRDEWHKRQHEPKPCPPPEEIAH